MLNRLEITNVALIQSASIDFSSKINVLSGETGAGKSVILESLNFVLGAKADKSLIRNGEDFCLVKAEFDLSDSADLDCLFDEYEIEKDDLLIISRKFSLDGKNSIKINGQSATVGMLKAFSSRLVDVHGQSEHFFLLKESNQLELIDKIAGEKVDKVKDILKNDYQEYKNLLTEIDTLGGDENARLIRIDIIKYQIDEINKCNLIEGEEENLISIKARLNYQEKIQSALDVVSQAISAENSVNDRLSVAVRSLSTISNIDTKYQELYDRLENAYTEIRDIGDVAKDYLDDFESENYNIDQIEARLDQIKIIKKKYGEDYSAIQEYLDKITSELEKLENFNDIFKDLLDKKLLLEDKLYNNYIKLDELRKETAKIFTNNVITELNELGMKGANFEVSFAVKPDKEDCPFNSNNGFSKVKFLFSANSGEALKPLSEVISGGEMSRFMLAIKVQTAKFNNISTFIFDEIDAGISGNVAKIVANKMIELSKNVQIVAISHLPQIASVADNNLFIYKEESEGRTLTHIKQLSNDERVLEIVRLVGGDQQSSSAISHAKELLSLANQLKNK